MGKKQDNNWHGNYWPNPNIVVVHRRGIRHRSNPPAKDTGKGNGGEGGEGVELLAGRWEEKVTNLATQAP